MPILEEVDRCGKWRFRELDIGFFVELGADFLLRGRNACKGSCRLTGFRGVARWSFFCLRHFASGWGFRSIATTRVLFVRLTGCSSERIAGGGLCSEWIGDLECAGR